MGPLDRRQFLKAGAAAAAAGPLISLGANAQGKPVVNLQLGWILGGNQIGEVCAKQMGFYDQEGIDLKFQSGGPNIDGWPLWRFHDSQMKNSEARKMPQSSVRRMSVMTLDRKTRASRSRAAHARAGR